jgi:hypothetical protein
MVLNSVESALSCLALRHAIYLMAESKTEYSERIDAEVRGETSVQWLAGEADVQFDGAFLDRAGPGLDAPELTT